MIQQTVNFLTISFIITFNSMFLGKLQSIIIKSLKDLIARGHGEGWHASHKVPTHIIH